MIKIRVDLKKIGDYKLFFALTAILFISLNGFAEPSVGVFKLEPKNIDHQTNAVINNAIFNFIKEQKKYEITDMRVRSISDEGANFDYIFTGTITGLESGIELKLILKNKADAVTRTISKIYGNANLILLDSRILVNNLFDMSIRLENGNIAQENTVKQPTSEDGTPVEITNIESLAGSWRGENGIERIEIMRGGRAIAVLSSGVSIFLSLKLTGGQLIVTQSGAPNARQFTNLPDNIAKKAAELGKTPAWKFLVSKDNKILFGEKTYTEIIYNNDSIISNKEVTEKVKWIKN